MPNLEKKFWDVVGTYFMSTHNFSYNFLTRIKYIFYTVAMVAYKGVGALDMFSISLHLPLSQKKDNMHAAQNLSQENKTQHGKYNNARKHRY
jgi:hypothetical protein